MTARAYFLGNRAWWAGALFIAPVVAALLGDPLAGVTAAIVLVLPVFILFDTDRRWWSTQVKALPQDSDRSRRELRLLTISAAAGLVLGLAVAYLIG